MSDRKYQKYRRLPFRIGTTRGKTFCCLWAEHRPDDAHTFHKKQIDSKRQEQYNKNRNYLICNWKIPGNKKTP